MRLRRTSAVAGLGLAAVAAVAGRHPVQAAVQEIHPHKPQAAWPVAGPATAGDSTVAVFGSVSTAPGAAVTANANAIGAAATESRPAPMPATAQSAVAQSLQRRRDAALVVWLALICGATDALFYRRYDCYANMMTGNTVKLGAALAAGAWREAARFGALIVAYLTGSGLLPLLKQRAAVAATGGEEDGATTGAFHRRLLGAMAPVCCGLFLAADVLGRVVHEALFLPLLALAFGLLNTATIDVTGAVTNAATGHLSKIGVGLGGLVVTARTGETPSPAPVPADSRRFLLGFVVSLVAGTRLCELVAAAPPGFQQRLPPLGVALAGAYGAVLLWYAGPLKMARTGHHPRSDVKRKPL